MVCDLFEGFMSADGFIAILLPTSGDQDDGRVLRVGVEAFGECDGACEFEPVVGPFTEFVQEWFAAIEPFDNEWLFAVPEVSSPSSKELWQFLFRPKMAWTLESHGGCCFQGPAGTLSDGLG